MSRDGLSFEPDVLRVIYGRERQRRQPSDGVSQYVEMTGAFAQFAEDPWADACFSREPIDDDVDADRRGLRWLADRGPVA
jgi:hypothetical protein